jgi:predicted DNA binding CopG/RHH family protein
MKLNKEEKELLKSIENGEWRQIPNFKKETKRYQESARETLRKNKRVNIRMTERDLVRIQKKAIEEGLPYQTLISSVLHKYINGRMVEKVS